MYAGLTLKHCNAQTGLKALSNESNVKSYEDLIVLAIFQVNYVSIMLHYYSCSLIWCLADKITLSCQTSKERP